MKTENSKNYIKKLLDDYEVVLSYKGQIAYDMITTILKQVKFLWKDNYVVSMRIYGIVNELLENVLFHGKNKMKDVEIVIMTNDHSTRIITFNNAFHKDTKSLIEKTNQINHKTKKEVKEQIVNKLDTQPLNENGSMGIGLEFIRLKSTGKINIGIEELVSGNLLITDVEINSK